MFRTVVLFFGILIFFGSCHKEEFPDDNDLRGTWIEQTNNSVKTKLIFDQTIFYIIKPTETDTFNFTLDDEGGRIWLAPVCNCAYIENYHEMKLNKRKNILSIWGILPMISGEGQESKFKKQ